MFPEAFSNLAFYKAVAMLNVLLLSSDYFRLFSFMNFTCFCYKQ